MKKNQAATQRLSDLRRPAKGHVQDALKRYLEFLAAIEKSPRDHSWQLRIAYGEVSWGVAKLAIIQKTILRRLQECGPFLTEDEARSKVRSISHGTARVEDLLPAFLLLMNDVSSHGVQGTPWHRRADAVKKRVSDTLLGKNGKSNATQQELLTECLIEIETLIGEVLPAGFYFGALEGDSSNYGIWLDEENA